jgi:methionyl-tRNA synthetase
MLTGTDEHGMKIQKAAQKAGMDVKLFCDKHMRQFEQLSHRADINYDHFIRTTDPVHKTAVEHFWQELNHRGYIYESKHEGWYSVSDETFFPQSSVHLVLDPATGRKHMASMETGREVEWTSEINYHFRLSEFKDRLLKLYKENPDFIIPASRQSFIIKEVESGLQDLSVSRPASRLQWGIQVPNDESQTIYVWLDALINYLTYAGYPFTPGSEKDSIWPPNCQVIGKDIIKFHCIYWPAFLMALDIPLPKQFLTHAFWTMNREKMSKSVGNVVNPFFAIDRFDADTMRYYMANDGGIVDDADYDNLYIVDRYKKNLQGGLGNLVSRIIRGKKWDLRESVESAQRSDKRQSVRTITEKDVKEEQGTKQPLTGSVKTISSRERALLRAQMEKLPKLAAQHMKELNPRGALHSIMDLIYSVTSPRPMSVHLLTMFQTNRYLHHTKVWDLVKDPNPIVQAQVQTIIFTCAESIRISAILLQPFMPSKMKRCLDLLGVEEGKRKFDEARYRADYTYGIPLVDPGKAGSENTLFPPLVAEW